MTNCMNRSERIDEIHSKYGDVGVKNNIAIKKAVESNNIEEVRLLLQDPRVDPSNEESQSIIALATEKQFYEVFELLLEHDAVDPNKEYAVITEILYNEDLRLMRLALKHPKFRIYPEQFLYFKDPEIMKEILEDGRMNPGLDTLVIECAINDKNIEVFKLLLNDPRVDPSMKNNSLLLTALNLKDEEKEEMIKIFMEHPKIDLSKGRTKLLETLVKYPNVELLKAILDGIDEPIDSSLVEKSFGSFKHQASKLFLEHYKKYPNGKINEYFLSAIDYINWDLVDFILDGFELDIKTNDKYIHNTIKQGRLDFIKKFLDKGANLEMSFRLSCYWGKYEIVKWFLESGKVSKPLIEKVINHLSWYQHITKEIIELLKFHV